MQQGQPQVQQGQPQVQQSMQQTQQSMEQMQPPQVLAPEQPVQVERLQQEVSSSPFSRRRLPGAFPAQARRGYPPGGPPPGGPPRGLAPSFEYPAHGPTSFADDEELAAAAAAARPMAQAEPEPDRSSEGPLSLTTRVEYTALPRDQKQDVFGLVTVQAAAAIAQSPTEARQPMDIVCVLDVSGSMQGDKIAQVKAAVRFIVDQAQPQDRLSIVAFNSSARRELPLRRMTVEGKNDATVAALRLSPGGGTSIAAGLSTALAVMEQRRQRNKVSAILLLTDGNDGSTRGSLPSLLARAGQARCSLYAFGFGQDHDAALLSQVAEQARTPFTFVEDTENLREAFAGAVGGLSSIIAQNVEVRLECQVPLKRVNTPFAVAWQGDRVATVTLPDIFSEERRDILVELEVPTTDSEGVACLLEASLRYTDLQTERPVASAPVRMEAVRVEEPQPEAEPDEEVSAQRERVEVTRALQEAAQRGDEGHFEAAQEVLGDAERRLQAKGRKLKFSDALSQEIADARSRMQSRSSWEQGGRAELRDAVQMHSIQRCTNMSISSKSAVKKTSKAMYVNSCQTAWIGASKSSQG